MSFSDTVSLVSRNTVRYLFAITRFTSRRGNGKEYCNRPKMTLVKVSTKNHFFDADEAIWSRVRNWAIRHFQMHGLFIGHSFPQIGDQDCNITSSLPPLWVKRDRPPVIGD